VQKEPLICRGALKYCYHIVEPDKTNISDLQANELRLEPSTARIFQRTSTQFYCNTVQ